MHRMTLLIIDMLNHREMTTRYLEGGIARLLPNREIIEMLAL